MSTKYKAIRGRKSQSALVWLLPWGKNHESGLALKCSQLNQSSRAFYSLSNKAKRGQEKKPRYLEFIASLLALFCKYVLELGEYREEKKGILKWSGSFCINAVYSLGFWPEGEGKKKKAGALWHTRRVECRKKIGKLVCPTQFQCNCIVSVALIGQVQSKHSFFLAAQLAVSKI